MLLSKISSIVKTLKRTYSITGA